MYRPSSPWTWSFVLITIIQAVIAIGFEAYVFAKFQTNLEDVASGSVLALTVPTTLTLFLFAFIYEVVLVFDALRLKNTIQVIGLCLCNIGLVIYAAVQIKSIKDSATRLRAGRRMSQVHVNEFLESTRPYLTAIPCILSVGSIAMSFVAYKLYDEFAWTIYKQISADLRLKRRYLAFQIYITLLKFDFLFFLGFTVQFVVILAKNDRRDYEFGLTIAAIPITIVILFLAAFWTRRENRRGMMIIILVYFAALAYFLFKLIRMYQPRQEKKYVTVRRPLTAFAIITLILIVITIVNAFVCLHNFGQGLMPHLARRKVDSDDIRIKNTEMPDYNQRPMGSRMVID